MNPIAIVGIYFVVWWMVLFAVLPFGMRTQEEEGDVMLGTARSAPVAPDAGQEGDRHHDRRGDRGWRVWCSPSTTTASPCGASRTGSTCRQ